ncbi:MAG: acyl-CoA thioesterase [Clostridia bacterium]|nr:acyl-CoA thioesterase [Clostridia bacterium]
MYTHKVKYYETDKMGITHHSNYIRWMEEARVDYLEKIGQGYDKLEAQGIISPVIGIECEYKETTTFNDDIEIDVKVKEYTGVRLIIEYEMRKAKNNALALKGISKHCFINSEGRPIRVSKENPELDKVLKELVEK